MTEKELLIQVLEKVDQIGTKVDNLEAKLGCLENKLGSLETKVDNLDTKVDSLETSMNERFEKVERKIDVIAGQVAKLTEFETKVEQSISDLRRITTRHEADIMLLKKIVTI